MDDVDAIVLLYRVDEVEYYCMQYSRSRAEDEIRIASIRGRSAWTTLDTGPRPFRQTGDHGNSLEDAFGRS